MTMVSLHPGSGVAPAPDTRVVKAGEYAALVEAGELLARAREEAASILEQARTAAGELRREGHEQGVLEGKAEVAGQMFEAMTASVEQLASMEKSIIDMVMRSLRTILGSFDREELAARTVGHALRLVRDEKRVLLRVAASDADAVQARLADLIGRYSGMGRVDVAPDASLAPGGCVMETELGVIDATLDRQLAMIEDAFRRHLEERGS